MKKYECLYIVNMNYDSEGTSAVVARVEEILKNANAEIVNTQHWGKRKLAYAINKERYGNYILLHFQGENPKISDFTRELEIEKGVLHYMTINLDKFPDFETLAVPQAYETDRRRPYTPGGRKPRRYDNEDRSGSSSRNSGADAEAPKVSEVVEDAPVSEEIKEAPLAAENVEESAGEIVEQEADKSADAE